MPVYTSRSQGGDAYDQRDFYREMAATASSPVIANGYLDMVGLIDRINEEFITTPIWLLTSHHHLVLMDSPDYDGGDWLVSVRSIVGQEYFLTYRMPDHICPFSRSTSVETSALGLEQAIQYIRIAMKASGGWTDSPELYS
jgi:hypothetical protein